MSIGCRFVYHLLLLLLLLTIPGRPFTSACSAQPPTTSGSLTRNETWSGAVILTGDVIVPASIVLIIEPGTKVYFPVRTDDRSGGDDSFRTELIVNGSLVAEQATFTSANLLTPSRGDWGGIRLMPKADHSGISFNGCTIAYATTAIRVVGDAQTNHLRLADSNIRYNAGDGIAITAANGADLSLDLNNNRITDNSARGIFGTVAGAQSVVTGMVTANKLERNGASAVHFVADASERVGLLIEDNHIHANRFHGIRLENRADIGHVTVSNNRIINGDAGISFENHQGLADVIINGNDVRSSRDGICINNGSAQTVTAEIVDNTLVDNDRRGLTAYAAADSGRTKMHIRANSVAGNGGRGIELTADPVQPTEMLSVISFNTVLENAGQGVYCRSLTAVELYYNDIRNNAGGVYVAADSDSILYFNNLYDNRSPFNPDQYELENGSIATIEAINNYWGPDTTTRMEGGAQPANLEVIFDHADNPDLGAVHYDSWLNESIVSLDSDADGLTDRMEFDLETDYLTSDTDGDLANDKIEVLYGSDPNDDQSLPFTLYEDAEDGLTHGWIVYAGDAAAGAVENVIDSDRGSRVIALTGDGVDHGYALYLSDGGVWNNTTEFIVEWQLQFTEPYAVYVEVHTTAGRRYLQYTPVDDSYMGNGATIHHGVGTHTIDGTWHMFSRDLAADLQDAQPEVDILAVDAFLIRGSGFVDDIKLTGYRADSDADGLNDILEVGRFGTDPLAADTDGDGLSDAQEINTYGTDPKSADSDGDGILDQAELAHWEYDLYLDSDADGLTNLLDADSDGDGTTDGMELSLETDPTDAASTPPTVYEDAEQLDTEGWFVYTGDPGNAQIANVEDSKRGGRVIELSGEGQVTGFALYGPTGLTWQNNEQFIIEWRLRYSQFFTVYVEVQTTAGRRYLQYTPVDYDNLGNGSIVHHGLGYGAMDGTWHRFIRSLEDDLVSVQPDAVILSVEGFLVRGSGRIDDIKLWTTLPDTDGDGLNDFEEIDIYGTAYDNVDTDGDDIGDMEEIATYATVPTLADTDADGYPDGLELSYWNLENEANWDTDSDGDGWLNLLDADSDNDGVLDGAEIVMKSDPADSSDTPASVYEDAQDGQIIRWDIYDGDPATASISNIQDQQRNGNVIELAGDSTVHGFRLGTESSRQWKNAGQFILDLSIRYAQYYIFYVDVQTTAGHRYLKYTPSDYHDLGDGQYVHHGLGWHTRNGTWQDLTIDLQSDLQHAQPDAAILEVNGLLIRGSGRIDDVRLRK